MHTVAHSRWRALKSGPSLSPGADNLGFLTDIHVTWELCALDGDHIPKKFRRFEWVSGEKTTHDLCVEINDISRSFGSQ